MPATPEPAVRRGRPEAAAVIWQRARGGSDARVDFAVEARRKRLRGLLQATATAVAGGVLFAFSWRTPAFVVFGLACVIAFAAIVAPTSLYAAIERGFLALGRLTGQAMGWLLLVPVFYLFFFPFGVLLRRGRRDRLQRVLDPEAETYWEPRGEVHGARAASDSYLRQF